MVDEYLNTTASSMVPWNVKPDILWNLTIRAGLILLYSFIFVICFFGNLAVILVVSFQWKKRSVSKYFLWNMAVANFSVSVFCILQNLTLHLLNTWIFGELMCKLFHFITNLCHSASILMVVLISIERYVVLLHSLRCRQVLTTRRLLLIICGVWLLSAGISLPRFFYFGLILIQLNNNGGFGHICVPIKSIYNSGTVDTIYFLLMYLVPLVVITALYLRVGRFLRQSERLRGELDEENRRFSIACLSVSNFQTIQQNLDDLNGPVKSPVRAIHSQVATHYFIRETKLFSGTKGCFQVRQNVAGTFVPDTYNPSSTASSSSILQRRKALNFDGERILYRYNRRQISLIRRKQSQRMVRMLVFIVVCFAILNLPYHLRKLSLHYVVSIDLASDTNSLISALTFALMYANCALNPVLYAFISKSFRTSLKGFCWKDSATSSTV